MIGFILILFILIIPTIVWTINIINYKPKFKSGDKLLSKYGEDWEVHSYIEVLRVGKEKYLLKNELCTYSMHIVEVDDSYEVVLRK